MEEDSKALANAGSHGVRVHFECVAPMSAGELSKLIGRCMLDMASEVTRQGGMVGHIKAFVRGESGTIRLNLVDPELGVDRSDTYGNVLVKSGTMNLMAVVVGKDDRQVEEAVDRLLRGLEGPVKLLRVEHGDHGEEEHHIVDLG